MMMMMRVMMTTTMMMLRVENQAPMEEDQHQSASPSLLPGVRVLAACVSSPTLMALWAEHPKAS
jgi:hypothetical protein